MGVQEELLDLYHAFSQAVERRDLVAAQAASAFRVEADELEEFEKSHPVLDAPEVVYAEQVRRWGGLVLVVRRRGSKLTLRSYTFAKAVDGWKIEGDHGETTCRRTGVPDPDRAALDDALDGLVGWARPKPLPPRSPKYVPPQARPKQAKRPCGGKAFAKTLVLGALEPVPAQQIDDAERELGCVFPPCYREFVSRFGGATYCDWVRVYQPRKVCSQLEAWRERVDTYFFWEAGAKILDFQSVLECVVVGDTMGGDEVVFHPADSKVLYLLPRDSGKIVILGRDLHEALDWLCRSGKLIPTIKVEYVRRPDGLRGVRVSSARTPALAFKRVLATIDALRVHDARADGKDEDGRYAFFASRALGGTIVVHAFDDENPGVELSYTPGSEAVAMGSLRAALEPLGYDFDDADVHEEAGER